MSFTPADLAKARAMGVEVGPQIHGSSVPHLAAAVRAYLSGVRSRPPIMFGIGDSNFGGNGAGLGGGTVGKWQAAYNRGPFMQLKALYPTLMGLRVIDTAVFGEANCTSDSEPVSEYDPRVTLSGGWGVSGTPLAIGGRWFETSSTTGELRVAFGQRIDVVEVYFVTVSGASADIKVQSSDGTIIGAFSCAGASGVSKATFTSAKFNDGIVRIKNNAGGSAFVAGVIAYPTNEPVLILAQGAWAGGTVGNYASTANPWEGAAFHPIIKPDYTLVQLTINDINYNTTVATYGTNLTSLLTTLTRSGDVVFSTGGIGNDVNYLNGNADLIIQKARQVCSSFSVPFINLHTRFDKWTSSNALGYEYDWNHRTYAGYTEQAKIFAESFLIGGRYA